MGRHKNKNVWASAILCRETKKLGYENALKDKDAIRIICENRNIFLTDKIELARILDPAFAGKSQKETLEIIEKHKQKKLNNNTLSNTVDDINLGKIRVDSKEFLSSYAWRKLRMEALKKYGTRCQCCGNSPKNGIVLNVDHIKPRRKYPELALDINNLQILCEECNHGKGNWDQTDWRVK